MRRVELNKTEDRKGSDASIELTAWEVSSEGSEAYQCVAMLCPEDEGGFSVHCLNLPGVISQGDDEAEAIANIIDAFRETLLFLKESGERPAWREPDAEAIPAAKIKRLLVRI